MEKFTQVWIRDDGEGSPEFTSDNDSLGVKFVPAGKNQQAAKTTHPDGLLFGELVVVSQWPDFDLQDAVVLGLFSQYKDGFFYVQMNHRGFKYCRKVVIDDVEHIGKPSGISPPSNDVGATHWAECPDGSKLFYIVGNDVLLWMPQNKVYQGPVTVPYTLYCFDDFEV